MIVLVNVARVLRLEFVRSAHYAGNTSTWIALAALVVAVASAVFAGVSVYWSHSEHVEFLKRLRARAVLHVTLVAVGNLAPGDDPLAVMCAPGEEFEQVFQIGISNSADSAAGPTNIDVLVPAITREFAWCDVAGRPLDPPSTPVETGEKLPREGGETPAVWINKELHRVSTRGGLVRHFKLLVERNERRLPIRVKAQCDELPDDVEEEIQDFELKIHDRDPPYALRGSVL
jgi:hypothetical protein